VALASSWAGRALKRPLASTWLRPGDVRVGVQVKDGGVLSGTDKRARQIRHVAARRVARALTAAKAPPLDYADDESSAPLGEVLPIFQS
jgi:hypothetical protein